MVDLVDLDCGHIAVLIKIEDQINILVASENIPYFVLMHLLEAPLDLNEHIFITEICFLFGVALPQSNYVDLFTSEPQHRPLVAV